MKILKYLFLILFAFFPSTLLFSQKIKHFTVVLDAGHGGKDSGALGPKKIMEKNINLNIVLITKEILNSFDKSILVILTRNKDKYIELSDRSKIAKVFNPDLFISIHCDASYHSSNKGLTIYLQNSKTTISKKQYLNYNKSLKFSLILNAILSKQLNLKTNGIAFNNYQILRQTIKEIPSLLVEIGFITNGVESNYLKTNGQKAMSFAIAKAILKYKNEYEH